MSRVERVAERIREDVSEIIREDVSDPRIGITSITEVQISPDLKNAKVFVSILGDEKKKKDGMLGLDSATKFIRGRLSQRLDLREVPQIKFMRDDSLDRGSRVLGIISKLESEEHEGNIKRSKKSHKRR